MKTLISLGIFVIVMGSSATFADVNCNEPDRINDPICTVLVDVPGHRSLVPSAGDAALLEDDVMAGGGGVGLENYRNDSRAGATDMKTLRPAVGSGQSHR